MHASPADPAVEDRAVPPPQSPCERCSRWVPWAAWCLLLAYTILLFFRARYDAANSGHQIALTDLLALRQWLGERLLASVQTGLCLFPYGFLVALGFGHRPPPQKLAGRVGRWLLMSLLGAAAFVFLFFITAGRLPGLLAYLLPITGLLLGLWVGRTAFGGFRALAWLVPKMMGLFVVALVALAVFGFLATERKPLPIRLPKVTSAEKRRLVDILRNPEPLDDGSRRLCFSQRDLNLILALGLPQVLPHARGEVVLDEGAVAANLSAPLAESEDSSRYVNIRTAWNVAIAGGELEITFVRCRIGRVPVPGFLLERILRQAIAVVQEDRDLNDVLNALGSFRVTGDRVEAVLVSRGLVDNVMPSLMARLGQSPNVVAKTRIYYEHLAKPLVEVPDDDRFATVVQSAFALARTRSETEDPVLENRAAILALAIMLGHWRVEHLVGPVTDNELRRQAREHVRFVRLRGRTDWSRHFLVSSALALVSNELLSDEAGLFKEEIDAGEGGSGFSFSDFLADRAGTLFALAATRDAQAARRMQQRLADGFDLRVIFPEAADLPEGIPDARLQSEYGGVGGETYQAMIAEIERRLGDCEGLR